MKFIFSIIAAVLIGGCASASHIAVEPKTVIKTEYIVRIPPAELLTPPVKVANIDIDIDTAQQSDVARWLNAQQDRMDSFESKLRGVAIFLRNEQEKLSK